MPDGIILYLLTGCFAGLVAGLLGVGGGLIIVPVLYTIFSSQGIDPAVVMHMALATSLATIVVTSLSSSYAHYKKQALRWRIFLHLTPGILAGAWAGGLIASRLDTSILKPVFSIFEFLVAVMMLKNFTTRSHHKSITFIHTLSGGLLIGLLSSIVGIGGGTLTVPFLHWFNINMKQAIATSAACGFPVALAGSLSYIYTGWGKSFLHVTSLGYINLTAFSAIILTSFLCAPLGATLAHSLNEKTLKKVFALFLLGLSLKMFLA